MNTKLELSVTGFKTSRPSFKFDKATIDGTNEYWTATTFESPRIPNETIGQYVRVIYIVSRAERWILYDAHVAELPPDYIADIGHYRYVIIFKRAERAAPEIKDALS